MAMLSVALGPYSAVLPTVHGYHYAFQKFPFFLGHPVYIYTTLKFLALLGGPYIYDISSLRVNVAISLSFQSTWFLFCNPTGSRTDNFTVVILYAFIIPSDLMMAE